MCFLNQDATQIDYKKLLDNLFYPKRIDYLSVDIDENTVAALNKLPLEDYRFSVITIEHDAYRFNDSLRLEERRILSSYGYTLLCSDVLVPLGCGMGSNLPFEDWWVDNKVFNMDNVHRLCCDKQYPDDIVRKVKQEKAQWLKGNE